MVISATLAEKLIVSADMEAAKLTVSDLHMNAEFSIDGTAVGTTVSAVHLDTLTDGSNADSLHTHGSNAATLNTNAEAVASLDMLYVSGDDTVSKAQADALATSGVIGAASTSTTGTGTESIDITLPGGILAGVLTDATAGMRIFLSDLVAGEVLLAPPGNGAGIVILEVGTASNPTDMFFNVQAPRVRA